MSNDTVRPDECDDETNRTYSTNVHSEKLHLPSEPKDNQPSRLLVGVRDMQRSNLITSQQAVASGVMVRSSTAGSRPSTFAAASFLSQNAKDVVAVAITATTGHTRRPRRNGSSHSYDVFPSTIRTSGEAERPIVLARLAPLRSYSALPHVAHPKTQKHREEKELKTISVEKVNWACRISPKRSISPARPMPTKKDVPRTIGQSKLVVGRRAKVLLIAVQVTMAFWFGVCVL
ncbi:hypothetical protein IWW34DRAFT_848923 [Fusarium oxysporum f. sp. albedinis]|nr:hypothetical protein IWW34DRAFT_848923 [Fusarium oxysporum f. sp. albedinis]KAK2471886.1 hypothetical protein H9L39_15766 [Fusarium oxysporum f. sp. albedinis]